MAVTVICEEEKRWEIQHVHRKLVSQRLHIRRRRSPILGRRTNTTLSCTTWQSQHVLQSGKGIEGGFMSAAVL